MLKISIEKLDDLFKAVAEKQTLYIPADRKDGASEYTKYENGMKLSKNLNTLRSAKDFFFLRLKILLISKWKERKLKLLTFVKKLKIS